MRERADSDSGGEEEGEEEEAGGSSHYRADAARLTAAEEAQLAQPQQPAEKQKEEALGDANARWGQEEED